MNLINLVEIDTIYGYKSIELHHGDLTKPNFEVDLLVVSAFKNSYHPVNGTLIRSLLDNRSISVKHLAAEPLIDLRQSLGVWMSDSLESQPYQRIACIEMLGYWGTDNPIEQSIKNLFSLINIAEMQDISITSIAMPLIGTGQQGISPEHILKVLMPICLKALSKISRLQKIIFVEFSAEKVEELDKAMNLNLARKDSDEQELLKNHDLTDAVKQELLFSLIKLKRKLLEGNKAQHDLVTLDELIRKIENNSLRFFELGLLSRRICELLVMDILDVKKLDYPLYKAIDVLQEKRKISSWIISYLHTLRVFGNEAAHEKGNKESYPAQINHHDLINIMFSLNRVVEFWIWYRDKIMNINKG
jgi:Domain of unknown function (DUF4145)